MICPKISIIMPVYNGQKYLKSAIESILNQTFQEFELIIIDDCSTDESVNIVLSYKDKKIVLIKNKANLGIGASLNIGLDRAKGSYIARMDADDISISNRLLVQYEFMKNNKDIGVCGSWYKNFGKSNKIKHKPIFSENIKVALLFDCVIGHSTVMIRKEVIDKTGLKYNGNYKKSQDYDLWSRLSPLTKFYNIPQVLVKYRVHMGQVGNIRNSFYSDKVRAFNSKNIFKELNILQFKPKYRANSILFGIEKSLKKEDLKVTESWIKFLVKKNAETLFYDNKAFKLVLINRFWRICKQYGMFGARCFSFSSLSKSFDISFSLRIKSFFYGFLPLKKAKRKFIS